MKRFLMLLVISAGTCSLCWVQGGDDSRPAPSNLPGAEFPRIHSDLKITFRVSAPGAQSVQVIPGGNDNGLGKGPYEMVRDEKGVWTVTTPPAIPGFHYYWLRMDGFATNDPSSRTFFGWSKECSGIEVPDKTRDFYDVKDVPHGEVRVHWYYSRVTASLRRAILYTPPNYDRDSDTRYPVLYLQHGMGESERGWTEQGRANFILDNLLAEKKAQPMVIVMENGMNAAKPGTPPTARQRQNEAFEEMVINDLIPMIDTTYRTIPDKEHRAIAGLSMGAGQAVQIGLSHTDRFSYIGSFSGMGIRNFDPKTSYGGVFSDPAAFNRNIRVLWFGAGTAEASWAASGKVLVEAMNKAGIEAVWFEVPGTSHEWQTWRVCLHDFAPRLFQN